MWPLPDHALIYAARPSGRLRGTSSVRRPTGWGTVDTRRCDRCLRSSFPTLGAPGAVLRDPDFVQAVPLGRKGRPGAPVGKHAPLPADARHNVTTTPGSAVIGYLMPDPVAV